MEDLVKEADEIVAQEIKERAEKREAEAKEALENEAKERGFNSIEAMQKFDDEKVKAEAKKTQVELSEQAQIKEDDGKDEEEEVTSKNKENVDPEEA
jgi:hypothetical protein